jgi:hypothetical protein
MPTRVTESKIDQAVKAVRSLLDCQDAAQHFDCDVPDEAVRVMLQGKVQIWNRRRPK